MPVERLPNGKFRAYDRDFESSDLAQTYQDARDQGDPISHTARKSEESRPLSLWWLALLLPAVVGTLLVVIGSTLPADPKNAERAAIEACWAEHARKSLTPAEQRLIASSCEGMEAEFKRTHGRAP